MLMFTKLWVLGRQFHKCSKRDGGCDFFLWADQAPPPSHPTPPPTLPSGFDSVGSSASSYSGTGLLSVSRRCVLGRRGRGEGERRGGGEEGRGEGEGRRGGGSTAPTQGYQCSSHALESVVATLLLYCGISCRIM